MLTISKAFPDWLGTDSGQQKRSKPTPAAFSAEEKDLLEGFRHADPGDKELMLIIARRALEVFTERAGKK